MAWTQISTGVQPWLNDRETTALLSHVEDWEKIFRAAAREAKILAPKMDKELLKQCKEIVVPQSQEPHQVIKEERKADILQQIHEEIKEEMGQKPLHKEVLRRYQPTMTAIMQRLDKKELQEAQAKADRWTNQASDATVQAKMARKKGEKMVKNFTKEMFTQAGMRVFVLGSWKDEKEGLLTSGMHSPVAKDESDGDADDESPMARPTRKLSTTATSSPTEIPKGQPRITKQPYISLTEDESNNTQTEASPPAVKERHHGCTNARDSNQSRQLGQITATHLDIQQPILLVGHPNTCHTDQQLRVLRRGLNRLFLTKVPYSSKDHK
ncbi:uncharacterized protein EDB93DRAFT_1107374 [Suillus bovinus]|uniref:uncharacterized protein n=1 Tax=Suillus bovinus TaxID=48563 RepID=UPI001B8671DC|nr:uncharacterized protein EDB93DRAFT_1107374 [Suillus bovinus]KAG2134169.1 hypothetical protein EDB93DRAFT_1107374 [Suillus bovinus]